MSECVVTINCMDSEASLSASRPGKGIGMQADFRLFDTHELGAASD